jgi:hypothetical protein
MREPLFSASAYIWFFFFGVVVVGLFFHAYFAFVVCVRVFFFSVQISFFFCADFAYIFWVYFAFVVLELFMCVCV